MNMAAVGSCGGNLMSAALAQCAVQMNIAAVDEYVLPGNMSGPGRHQKDHHGRDLIGASHPVAQRNL